MPKPVLLVLAALLLPACGQKGPLYLPQQKPAADAPASAAPVPATQPAAKKNPQ